jgi:TRAP-type C4-dicarboxylate transport system substrate-binding protein
VPAALRAPGGGARRRAPAAAVVGALLALAPAGDAGAQTVIKLKLSHFAPVSHNQHVNVLVPWTQEVKRRTGGRVQITVFPSASLCKPTQQYECARAGIADIAWGVPGWTPNRFPMTSVIELPFMHRTAATGSQMLADLWERYVSREYDDIHVLAMNVHPAGHIHTSTRLIRTLEDFKGMKIRTPTAVVGDMFDMLGAIKVGMPATQIYEAMSQGTVDGFGMPFEALPPFRLHEVSRYHTEIGMYTTAFALMMNKAKYESLPPDIRGVLDETTSARSGYWKRVGALWDGVEAVGRKAVLDRGNQIYTVPRQERQRWRETAKPLDEIWAANLEKRGLPGRALLQQARELSARSGEAD